MKNVTTNIIANTEPITLEKLKDAYEKLKPHLPKEEKKIFGMLIIEDKTMKPGEWRMQSMARYGVSIVKRYRKGKKQVIFPISKKKRIQKKFAKNPENYIDIQIEVSLIPNIFI